MSCFSYFNKKLNRISNEKDIFVELNFLIMIIDDALPKFDLPVDFVTDDSITGDILNQYGRFPCHIKAESFVLVRGELCVPRSICPSLPYLIMTL